MPDSSLPKTYTRLLKRYPVFSKALANLGEIVHQQGPVDAKNAQLIQLAAAASVRSEGAVLSHAHRALELGSNEEEIRHTLLLLTSTIGFPAVAAALSWVEDIFD